MKRAVFVNGIILLLIAFSACEKENSSCNFVPARIIRYDCDRVIFQLLTEEKTGDRDWEDVLTGQHYNNVVSYYQTCKIASITQGRPDTLYLEIEKINENKIPQDCIQCQALSPAPPATKIDILSFSYENCSGRNAAGN